MERVHHFYVAVAKHVFRHSEHGLVRVPDPISLQDAASYGLTPLLLYCVTVAGLPYRVRYYLDVSSPRDLGEVLSSAWSDAKWLKGRPDKVRVSKHLAKAAPRLEFALASAGVELEIASPKEKSLPAAMRSAQTGYLSFGKGTPRDPLLAAEAAARETDEPKEYSSPPSGREMQEAVKRWDALQLRASVRFDEPLAFDDGDWLRSWETSVPPPRDRFFYTSPPDAFFGVGNVSLLVGNEGDFDEVDEADEELVLDAGYYREKPSPLAKAVLSSWPRPLKEVAEFIGVTQKELNWFLSGKADFSGLRWQDLSAMLTMSYDECGSLDIKGPLVLIARKERDIKDCWNAMTHGGDSNPCEVVPSSGEADPSWRYVIVNRDNDHGLRIVMSARGSSLEDLGRSGVAMNSIGRVAIPSEIYASLVQACGSGCASCDANSHAIRGLMFQYQGFWNSMESWSRWNGQIPDGVELLEEHRRRY